jgi:hypothetical protein
MRKWGLPLTAPGAASLAVLVLVTACGSPAGGLPRQKAVTSARTVAQGVSSTPVTFVSAASGRLDDFETGTPNPRRQVWAVTFDGTFQPPSCGPAGLPHPCPSPASSIRVFLDYTSGTFVMAEYPPGGS